MWTFERWRLAGLLRFLGTLNTSLEYGEMENASKAHGNTPSTNTDSSWYDLHEWRKCSWRDASAPRAASGTCALE